jgi:hypothetical protein
MEDEIVVPVKPFYLGVFGTRSDLQYELIIEDILMPLFEITERVPEKVLGPSEGYSTLYLEKYATSHNIPWKTIYTDWQKHGRKATFMRDYTIERECNYALVFLNKKTQTLEKYAERLTKKGKHVFTYDYNNILTYYALEESEPEPLPVPVPKQKKQPSILTYFGK